MSVDTVECIDMNYNSYRTPLSQPFDDCLYDDKDLSGSPVCVKDMQGQNIRVINAWLLAPTKSGISRPSTLAIAIDWLGFKV